MEEEVRSTKILFQDKYIGELALNSEADEKGLQEYSLKDRKATMG